MNLQEFELIFKRNSFSGALQYYIYQNYTSKSFTRFVNLYTHSPSPHKLSNAPKMVIVTFPKSIMKFTDLPTSDSGYTTAEGEQPKPSAPLTHKQLLERNPKDTENVTSRLATEIRALKTYHISKDLVGLAPRRGWPSHEAKEEVMSPRMKERLARLRGDINGLLRR